MDVSIDNEEFVMYRYIDENKLYVAVAKEYNLLIEQAINEYGAIDKVPVEKTVQGIFITNNGKQFKKEAQQSDITINRLRKV